jgi:hypothetical protein
VTSVNISMNVDVDLEEWARIWEFRDGNGQLDLDAAKQDLIDSTIYGMLEQLYEHGVLNES